MGWSALDNIDEALKDTKDKLLPFDAMTWAKLAVIILLTGYTAGGPSYMSFPTGPSEEYSSSPGMNNMDGMNEFSSSISHSFEASSFGVQNFQNGDMHIMNGFNPGYTVMFLVGVFLFALLLSLTYITSVFQFVMYKSMIEDVKIGHAKDFLGEGLQYLIFRWLTLVAIILVVGLGIGLGSALNLSFNAFGVLAGLFIGLGVLSGVLAVSVLRWLAFNFALPEMIRSGSGLNTSLSKSLEIARSEIREVALFWLMKLVIGIGLGVAAFSIMFPVFILLLIPFGVIGFLLMILTPLLLVPVIVLYLLTAIVAGMFVAVPIRVYVYSYILEMHEDLFQ
jgi:hypothetical protein